MRTQMRQLERNSISLDMSSDEATIAKGVSPEIVADCLQNASNSTLILDCRPFMAFNETHIKHSSNVHCPPILKRRSNGFVSLENIVPCERQRRNLQDGHYRNVIICDADTKDLSSPAKDSNLNSVIKSLKQQVEINDVMFLIGTYVILYLFIVINLHIVEFILIVFWSPKIFVYQKLLLQRTLASTCI